MRIRDYVVLILIGIAAAGGVVWLFRIANATNGVATWFSALAGWAQAWGALMAIGAAYAIARQQGSEERRKREETRRSALKTLKSAVEYGHGLLADARNRFADRKASKSEFDRFYAPDSYEAVIETLNAAPVYDLGMYEVSMKLIEYRLLLTRAKARLDATVAGMKDTDERSCGDLHELHTRSHNLMKDLLDRVENPGPTDLVPAADQSARRSPGGAKFS